MWIFIQKTGRTELVLNPDHIARLLGEGGTEVADPRVPVKDETITEVTSSIPATGTVVTGEEVQPEEQHEEVYEIIDISHKRRKRRASQ
jgi:hypothetical protein